MLLQSRQFYEMGVSWNFENTLVSGGVWPYVEMGGCRSHALFLFFEIFCIVYITTVVVNIMYVPCTCMVKHCEWCHHKCVVCTCMTLAVLRWRISAGGEIVRWLTISIIKFAYLLCPACMFTDSLGAIDISGYDACMKSTLHITLQMKF